MGSPISPVIANLVMENLEQKVIRKLPFTLPFYKRYLDDILTVVHKDNVDLLLQKFNNFHPRINFTHELESDGRISFLDTVVINHQGKIITDMVSQRHLVGKIFTIFILSPTSIQKECCHSRSI